MRRASSPVRVLGLFALAPVIACTPWGGDDWPPPQVFDSQRIEPVATPDPGPPAPAPEVTDAPSVEAAPDPCLDGPPAPTLPLHPALTLDLRNKGPSALEPGQYIKVEGRMRNASKSKTHRAVLPGDGSEVGWREPEVWYTAQIDREGTGCWRAVEKQEAGRCGMFDAEWRDDLVTLKPGKSAKLDWLGNPAYSLELQQPGRVRLFLHYAFRGGATARAAISEGEAQPDPFNGEVEPFEMISNPIEFELRRPLELVVVPRPEPHKGRVTKVSQIVSVELRNVGDKARVIKSPTSSRLRIEVQGDSEKSWPNGSYNDADESRPPFTLEPGASRTLTGKKGPTPGLQFDWVHLVAEPVRIRATYQPDPSDVESPSVLHSEWVELDLSKNG